MARRWCLVEQDEQLDLFVEDSRHVHLVDINLRLDVPRERTLCADLLPSRPIYRELTRADLRTLCPACGSGSGSGCAPGVASSGRSLRIQSLVVCCVKSSRLDDAAVSFT